MRATRSSTQSGLQITAHAGRFKDLPALPVSGSDVGPSTSSVPVESTFRSLRGRWTPSSEEETPREPETRPHLASWTVEKDPSISQIPMPTIATSAGTSRSIESLPLHPRKKKVSLAGQMLKRASDTLNALTNARQAQEADRDIDNSEARTSLRPSISLRKHKSCVSVADDCDARSSTTSGRSRPALLQTFTQGLSKMQSPPVVSAGINIMSRGRMKSTTSLQEKLNETSSPDDAGASSILRDSLLLKNGSMSCLGDPPTTELGDSISTPAPAALRRKGSRLMKRPTTASSATVAPIQTYLIRLSLPPQGLPIGAFEERKMLATSYVQRRLMEEARTTGSRNKIPAHSSASTTPSADDLMERFEAETVAFVHKEMKRGVESARFRELRFADVFIEARRDLGLEPSIARLHQLFDMPEPHPDLTNDTTVHESEPSTPITSVWPSLSPPSAWDTTSRRMVPSLGPAPRRRRPRTSPVEPGSATLPARHRWNSSRPTLMEITAGPGEAEESTPPSMDGSSICSFEGVYIAPQSRRFEEDNKGEQLQVLTPEFFSSRVSPHSTNVSLPPTPPRSSESHFSGTASTWERVPLDVPPTQYSRKALVPSRKNNTNGNGNIGTGPIEGNQFEVMLKEGAWSEVRSEC